MAAQPPSLLSGTASALIDEVRRASTLEIIIPEETPAADAWAPHRFRPSTVLTQLSNVHDWHLPKAPENVELHPGAPYLVLTKRLGTNGPCDIYEASLRSSSGQEAPGLIAKFLDLSHFAVKGLVATQRTVEVFCASQVISFNVLAPLYGTCVPHFGGLFGSGTLYCMVFEDGGRLLHAEERRDANVQEEILDAVKAIHAAGVAVAPQDWTNICRGPDGHIKIVDLYGCRSVVDVLFDMGDDTDIDPSAHSPEEWLEPHCEDAITLTKEFFEFGPSRTTWK